MKSRNSLPSTKCTFILCPLMKTCCDVICEWQVLTILAHWQSDEKLLWCNLWMYTILAHWQSVQTAPAWKQLVTLSFTMAQEGHVNLWWALEGLDDTRDGADFQKSSHRQGYKTANSQTDTLISAKARSRNYFFSKCHFSFLHLEILILKVELKICATYSVHSLFIL